MRIIIDNTNEKQYRLHIGVSGVVNSLIKLITVALPLSEGRFFLSRAATATAATTTDADDGYPAGFTQETNGRTAQQNSSRSETRGTKTEWQKQMGTADKKEDCLTLA